MRVEILNCPIDTLDMNATVAAIDAAIQTNRRVHHVVVNAAKLVNMQRDAQLRESVVNCDIINADGQSVVWAGKLLGKPLKERVAGIDLMNRLVQLAKERKYKIFLLGAEEEIVHAVAEAYGAEIVAGYRNGYFRGDEAEEVAAQIATSGAQMLFVAISSPKKEIFLNRFKDTLDVPFIMGVGGAFDVIAGKVKRAPIWMQNAGLEWLYRLVQEPRRMWKRYLVTNSVFIYLVLKEKLARK
jgi:N-acetylglucosaminyldiphosphoundecaprenol N-acetyl-beta-D-mannosaminyltransferase